MLLCQIRNILGDNPFRMLLVAPCFDKDVIFAKDQPLSARDASPALAQKPSEIQFAFEKLSAKRALSKLWLSGLKISITVSKTSIIQPSLRKTSPSTASLEWCPLSWSLLRALCVCGLFLPLPACIPRLCLMTQSIQQLYYSYHM